MDRALGHAGGLQALRKGGEGLLRIGGTGKGRTAQVLERFDFLRTVLQQLFVHGARRLWLARLGVEEHPALLDATRARPDNVIAIAVRERSHRLRIGLGQARLRFAQGGWDSGDPLGPRIREFLEVLGTLEGTIGDQHSRPIVELQRRSMIRDNLAKVVRVTTNQWC